MDMENILDKENQSKLNFSNNVVLFGSKNPKTQLEQKPKNPPAPISAKNPLWEIVT